MTKKIIFLAVFTAAFALVIIFQAKRLPADAKQCGDHYLKFYSVNQGLYSCRIYGKDKKFLKEQTYMLPYKHWRRSPPDLAYKVEKYDGDTIYLDKGAKLLACSVPPEAQMVQSVDCLVWIKYEPMDKEKNMYYCEVYSTRDGSVVSAGAYDLKKYHWDKKRNRTVFENAAEPMKTLSPYYYGGVSIALKNNMVLMPDNFIDYNTGTETGLRIKYDKAGNELEREDIKNSF